MKLSRRNFFGVAAGGAVSAPVIAKEATAKMGIEKLGYASHYGSSVVANDGEYGTIEWARKRFEKITERGNIRYRRANIRANQSSMDPDLASMRSVSPSAAYNIQVERAITRSMEREKMDVIQTLEEYGVGIPEWMLSSLLK